VQPGKVSGRHHDRFKERGTACAGLEPWNIKYTASRVPIFNSIGSMTDSSSVPPYDEKQIRCPKLGGQVNFAYCRVEKGGQACPRAIACWTEHFDVESYFRKALSPNDFESCFSRPPQPKLVTLVELIERAQRIAAKAAISPLGKHTEPPAIPPEDEA